MICVAHWYWRKYCVLSLTTVLKFIVAYHSREHVFSLSRIQSQMAETRPGKRNRYVTITVVTHRMKFSISCPKANRLITNNDQVNDTV